MYKCLLAWRYLRTRFIALASIVSVTLGVATLIVVNSVMAGFIEEMHKRLHGILSDVEVASPGLGELYDPAWHLKEIRRVLGPDIEDLTVVVRVPALLHYEFRGRPMTQQIMLIGIDDLSFGRVTDFFPYLMNEHHRASLDFELKEDGYDEVLGYSGWPYRREMVALDRLYQQRLEQIREHSFHAPPSQSPGVQTNFADSDPSQHSRQGESSGGQANDAIRFAPLPDEMPQLPPLWEDAGEQPSEHQSPSQVRQPPSPFDPYAELRPRLRPEEMFDAMRDQYTGIVLGVAIASRRFADPETGKSEEMFLLRPGDDVRLTLPTAGAHPSPVAENCTIVDLYRSNMHEYDSMFAFMPLSRLQSLRGMIDPVTGITSASAIQIKLRPGVNLSEARDKLLMHFPPDRFPYVIQTWQDTQRPLLAAVELEVTILNILLFLIIAVAGFGILATFFMIVVEKTRDIGILKALGAPSRGVMTIFLTYGLSLGSVGTGVGIVLGLLFVKHINDIAAVVQQITGREIFDPTIYYFHEIPTIVYPGMVFLVASGAMLIAVLASVLPALRAARLHPVEALRYE